MSIEDYLLVKSSLSKTSNYLLAMLDMSYSYYMKLFNKDFNTLKSLKNIDFTKEESNIFDCLLDKQEDTTYLIIVSDTPVYSNKLDEVINFTEKHELENFKLHLYYHKIKEEYREDVEYFKKGHYSKFSERLKQANRELKTPYIIVEGKKLKNPHICVLDKDPKFKKLLSEYLNCKIDRNAELRQAPDNTEYWNYYKDTIESLVINDDNFSII